MKLIGHVPVMGNGKPLLGGVRRFKIYRSPALANAAHPTGESRKVFMEETGQDVSVIPTRDLQKLQEAANWLAALEDAGVDNWDGIDVARETLEEWESGEI